MGQVKSTAPRPIQGVSQQPDKVRNDGQCSVQDNMFPSVVDGLKSRMGTRHIARLMDTINSRSKLHYYTRDSSEQYFVISEPSTGVRVFRADGVEQIVNDLTSSNYCYPADPLDALSLQTISDYTFIANNTVDVARRVEKSPDLTNEAIINVQFANYGKTYEVWIDEIKVASFQTPDGDLPAHVRQVDTSYVAGQLHSDMVASLTGFTLTLDANTVHIIKDDGSDFDIYTVDGTDGNDVIAVKGLVTQTQLLPTRAPDGFTVKVQQRGEADADGYWLVADKTEGDTVKWLETIAPSSNLGFDKATMPHVLVRESIDPVSGISTFTLREGEWDDRSVGDDESNPFPSFIDDVAPLTINSIGIFQNRLYFTAGESVIMTRSGGEFFNFFRKTTQTALDTDPIEAYADSSQINNLINSVTLDGDLVFFSENAQFIIRGDQPVTKSSITMSMTNTFKSQTSVSPVAAGENIFFPFDYGKYTGVREFFTDSITDTKRARPITEHVESYIEGKLRSFEASSNNNWLLALSAESPNVLYVYNWLWVGQEKVQSAWHRWVWPTDEEIMFMQFQQNNLYLIISRASGVYLEVVDLGDEDDSELGYPVRLDRMRDIVFTRVDDHFEADNPLLDEDPDDLVFVSRDGVYEEDKGTAIDFEVAAGKVITYDMISELDQFTASVGKKIRTVYVPTTPLIKDRDGNVMPIDRLMISRIYLNYEKTGKVSVTVRDRFGGEQGYLFSGRFLGAYNNILGFAELTEGTFQVPVMQRSSDITLLIETASHYPFQLRDFEWTGRFHGRGRRV